MSNDKQPWPPSEDDIKKHDEQADKKRQDEGLKYTKKDTCPECGQVNSHAKGCSKK